jgi:hypothetical protein
LSCPSSLLLDVATSKFTEFTLLAAKFSSPLLFSKFNDNGLKLALSLFKLIESPTPPTLLFTPLFILLLKFVFLSTAKSLSILLGAALSAGNASLFEEKAGLGMFTDGLSCGNLVDVPNFNDELGDKEFSCTRGSNLKFESLCKVLESPLSK